MANRTLSPQVVVGAVIVVLGVLLFLDSTGLYETGPLFRYAPSLFVLVGLYALVTSGFRNLIGPLALVLVAGGVQLVTLGIIEWASLAALWPIVVILFGLSLLAGRFTRGTPTTEQSVIETFSLFGGTDRRAVGDGFERANLTVLFGGTTLDLRDVTPASQPARVNVTALFGGVEIVVPRDWNVELDVLPVFGAAEDSRLRVDADHETVDLVVSGSVAFGGVEVKD
ncbi:DUF5668 domain-containing protein [Halolamina litorea]|uniref:LiaF domain-containing protein n=1 Tax=Halolamina litorea TaxID=1515593 RepID=A0ABD6BT93_9EURY|nr:LiaF domain-containing protein [Halolamina litorea]